MSLRWLLSLLLVTFPLFGQKSAFTPEALLKLVRINDPQLSPEGRRIAFTVQTINLEANKSISHIYVVDISGGPAVQLTYSGEHNFRPRWSPDGKQIAFVSDRSGTNQIWIMDADGANVRQLTGLSTGAEDHLFSPDGKYLIFRSRVYPECGADDECNRRRLEEEKTSPVKARVYESLLYRHWDHWKDQRRWHLFSMNLETGQIVDLTPGDRDVPPFSLGGHDNYAVSPSGAELCYVMKTDPEPALSTNTDLYIVPLTGGEPYRITDNPAADESPVYSPDGRYLAYRAQTRPGFESDRWRLMLLDRMTGKLVDLTAGLDRSVGEIQWSPDSRHLFFTIEDRGRVLVQLTSIEGTGTRTVVFGDSSISNVQLTPDGQQMVYIEESANRPPDIYVARAQGGPPAKLTNFNNELLAQYELPQFEEFWVDSSDGARIHSFLLKPPNFDSSKRYPVLFLIHGGPQGAWGYSWSYRWNAQVFAGAGYVVVLPNPRGSTGYGQRFTDEISRDWGGKVYQDLTAVFDYVTQLPFVDPTRQLAAGASYGGYMINWILGHTDRFRALVSHAGVFDLRSFFGETEELWFPLWEFGGPPWKNPELYQKFSPSSYVLNFKTPTLVTHGEKDYRVPYGQALQLFTALKLRGVPAKLVLFPDEGHWVLKPQNSLFWYHTVLDWLAQWSAIEPTSTPATTQAPITPPAQTLPH